MNRPHTFNHTFRSLCVSTAIALASSLAHAESRVVLNFSYNDNRLFTAEGDWAFGDAKGECGGSTFAVAGISSIRPTNCGFLNPNCIPEHTVDLLCTSLPFGADEATWNTHQAFYGDDRANTKWGDWAFGFTKLECDENEIVTGVAQAFGSNYDDSGMLFDAIRCIRRTDGRLASNCVAHDFRYGDSRETTSRGDWSYGNAKGECSPGRFVKGAAGHFYEEPGNDDLGARTLFLLCCS
jgi:hypothetical protein